MNTPSPNIFTLNGCEYDLTKIPQEGKNILGLINEAQLVLNKLETRKTLMQAAQQQLINQLKPYLGGVKMNRAAGQLGIIGNASVEIPTTVAQKPTEAPASFPLDIPSEIRNKST